MNGVTRYLKVNPAAADLAEQLRAPAAALAAGELVAFPTETVYGLGGHALMQGTIASIYQAKGRPSDNPLIVHVASVQDIPELVREFPPLARMLAERFMPGPLTLVLPRSDKVPDRTTGGQDTVAVRIPAHPVAHTLIELAAVPVAAPSANISGRPSPTLARHVAEDLDGRISWLIDGGPTDVGVESTVLDLTSGTVPRILRPGAVTWEMLCDALEAYGPPEVPNWRELLRNETPAAPDIERPRSPGMKYRHYSPRAPLYQLGGQTATERRQAWAAGLGRLDPAGQERIGLLCSSELLEELAIETTHGLLVHCWGSRADHAAAAKALFAVLRDFDEQGCTLIIAEPLPREDVAEAYMNRLDKASSGRLLPRTLNILFVCTGNTCRSPMAEQLLSHKLAERGIDGVTVASAGLAAQTGAQMAAEALRVLSVEYGIDGSSHRSRQLDERMVQQADLVLTMNDRSAEQLRRVFPEAAGKIRAFDPAGDIADPWGGSLEDYRLTAKKLAALADDLIQALT